MVRDNHGGGSSRSSKPYRSLWTKLYEMVNDPSTDSIVLWSQNGNSFIVWNQYEFCNDILPSLSQSRVLSIFTRRLGTFGFRKVMSEEYEYANDNFVRGRPELVPEIQKRYIASLPPDAFVFKRAAEASRGIGRIRALKLAIDESAVTKNLSNLTLSL
ncbi:hypothetical protein AALP_AA8G128300 [Arabis alpina]|uniref:HSF-type DNA-binding domain-containing protein n=1 Tax=Arabis alpina TaxID=50452 RepID=A0A087G6N8_ARAAL|nr:hypothetical protein AALP_AA8G128300 [Arabis alpina]